MAGRVWLSTRLVIYRLCKNMLRHSINLKRGSAAGMLTQEAKAGCVKCV